jgi:hypothetical protein
MLIFFEYFEYELLTHNAAAPEMRAPKIIIRMYPNQIPNSVSSLGISLARVILL